MRAQTLWQAKWILLVILAALAASWRWAPFAAVIPGAMLLFTIWFFRDPRREIPQGPGLLVSPADGKVTDITEMEEKEVTGTRMIRVGIFLSVFDVHVNRAPAAGRIVYTAQYDGDYHDARSPMASTHNTARTWGIDAAGTMLVLRQITGAIARRIVPWSMLGDQLSRGERFGMIRFGSRTELFLPLEGKVDVAVGQMVKGGSTVIGRLPAAKEALP